MATAANTSRPPLCRNCAVAMSLANRGLWWVCSKCGLTWDVQTGKKLKECITSERSASLTRGGDMARRRLLAINDLAQKLVDEVEVEDVRYVYEKGGL